MAVINGTGGADTINGRNGDDVLSGLGGNDVIRGYDGNDRLDGGTGNDRLVGGAGNDTYYVDSVADLVLESSGGGTDLVLSSVSFSLAGQYAEQLTLTGSAASSATGNILANILMGNKAANVLNGGAGADVMKGMAGHDIYDVDNAGDQVIELSGQGVDTVRSAINYTLGSHVENLTLTGTAALDATGNSLANTLTGNAAANRLDGGAGNDTMRGGAGDDTYVVDSALDQVTELSGGGTDTVRSSVSLSLGAYLENLILGGTNAIDGTGNSLANSIRGNGAANVLNGLGGADLLTSGGGRDTFAFTTALGSGNVDRIADFAAASDRILLGGAAGQPFAGLASGALGAAAFRVGAAALDADDRIVYNNATGALSYDADGLGGAAAVQFATLAPKLSLTASHFTVSGPANTLPTISSAATASVAENVSTSTIVYQTLASDADGDRLVYSLSGTDAARFRIDQSGAVRFVASPDFETKSSYNFTVKALDSSGAGDSQAVALSITDVAEGLRIVQETTAFNDDYSSAQTLSRNLLRISSDPNLPNDSLPSLRVEGGLSSPADKDYFAVTLDWGEVLILDVDGTPTLDSVVRIFSQDGVWERDMNDDLGSFDPGSNPHPGVSHNQDSFLRFIPPHAGTYYFSIEAFDDGTGATTDGAYQINVSIGVMPQDELDQENVSALLSGEQWSSLNLAYGFPSLPSDYAPGEGQAEIDAGMEQLNVQQQETVRKILGQTANLTNLSFSESGSPGQAQLRYALSSEPETAHAYYPGVGEGGDSWYNNVEYDSPVVGNYEWTTFLHETGHALGLKHAQESPSVAKDRDSLEYTVMTYRSYIGAAVGDEGGYTNETWGFPQTFMMYDIAALQRMYGADFSVNASDSVYSWSPTTGAFRINGVTQWVPGGNRIFMTIWDGGGIDTYDLSNAHSGMTIDLRPGQWLELDHVQRADLGDGHRAVGNVANALLYNGDPRSLIENAIGGAAPDFLVANAAVNRLTGGGGADGFGFAEASHAPPAKPDTITDFTPREDYIFLAWLDGNTLKPDHQMFELIGTNAFTPNRTDERGEVRYDVIDGDAHVFADNNRDGVADLYFILQNVTELTFTDFRFL